MRGAIDTFYKQKRSAFRDFRITLTRLWISV